MKNLKKAEFAVISLTLLSLAFTAGFFIGRSTSAGVVTIQKTSAADAESSISISYDPDLQISGTEAADTETPDTEADAAGNTLSSAPEPSGGANAAGTPAAASHESKDADAAVLVNINTATAEQLDILPGIGEVLAGRIIEYREKTGGFGSTGEIMEVSGIGEKKYSDIKDMITVG